MPNISSRILLTDTQNDTIQIVKLQNIPEYIKAQNLNDYVLRYSCQ